MLSTNSPFMWIITIFNPKLSRTLWSNKEVQQEEKILATLAAHQPNQLNLGAPCSLKNNRNEDLGDDELVDPINGWWVHNVSPVNQNHQAQVKGHQQSLVNFTLDDKDEANFDRIGDNGVIMLPLLAPKVNFNITNIVIQFLNLKGLFGGLPSDDPNIYLVIFINICKSFDFLGVG